MVPPGAMHGGILLSEVLLWASHSGCVFLMPTALRKPAHGWAARFASVAWVALWLGLVIVVAVHNLLDLCSQVYVHASGVVSVVNQSLRERCPHDFNGTMNAIVLLSLSFIEQNQATLSDLPGSE